MLVDFTIVNFMDLAVRYLLMVCVFKEQRNIWDCLEVKAITFFETVTVDNIDKVDGVMKAKKS